MCQKMFAENHHIDSGFKNLFVEGFVSVSMRSFLSNKNWETFAERVLSNRTQNDLEMKLSWSWIGVVM